MIYVEILETEESKKEMTVGELSTENPIRLVRYRHVIGSTSTFCVYSFCFNHAANMKQLFSTCSDKEMKNASKNLEICKLSRYMHDSENYKYTCIFS